ncbi:titin homolog isoform X2 [Eurosta solidaginis]|uniref:titin homolog isoform X2 n=1 Tax=Eurosta solidaginis TaxID=178769 RepID=UPI003530EF77
MLIEEHSLIFFSVILYLLAISFIAFSSDIQPTTKTALTITGRRNGMQRDDQIVDFAPNTNINMSTRNSLSNTYFKNQQDLQLKQLAHSEVRDPSSQEVQIIYRCFACEKSIRVASVHPPAKQSSYVNESTTSTSLTPTPSTALTTAESPPVQNDCQCLVNKNRCSILDAGDCDVNCISTETDDEGNERSTDSGHASIANEFLKGSDNAMTIQKVVEVNEEGNISASSSELDDNQYSIGDKRSLSGMKVDMNSSKLAPGVTTPTISSNSREKSEPKKVMSVKGNNVLAAATDISKLANFGKTRRESSLLSQSGSAASVDEKDSVLPTRTLIRRQKRLQLQGPEDKQEDPTERLNRLRARISGALTEVKGVLKHYSVDDSAETNQTPPLTNSATVGDRMTATEQKPALSQSDLKDEGSVSFRFVKKVRRRSVFSDDDANKIRKECTVENTGVEPTTKDEVNTSDKNKKKGAEEVRESLKEHGNEPTEVAYHISEGNVANNIKKPLNATSKENEISNGQNNIAIPAIPLGTVDETKTGDELNLQRRLQRIEPEITENWPKEEYIKRTENVVKKEYKDKNVEIEDKQNIDPQPINTKKSSRRASVALAEGSQIDPPVNTLIPLKIKTQRRPSDSETLIKQKIKHTETGSNTSIKKAKTVVKRPSVKSNNVVITQNKSASNAEINQSNKNIKDAITSALEVSSAITSVDAVTTKKKITETVPKTSETFSTRLAITIAINDASSLSSAEKPNDKSTKATQPLSTAINNSRTPTKLADQNGASVAPLVRPLRTGESNSHKNKTQTQPLPPPTSNTKIDTPFAISPKDQCTNEEYLNVSTPTQITSVSGFNIIDTIKKDPRISGTENNLAQPLTQEEPHKLPTELCTDIMPEQQVAPTPVKSVQVFAEKDLNKTTFPTKKIIVKRIVRKNSVDKAIEKNKANNSSSITVADETEKHERLISDSQSLIDLVREKSESTEEESALCDEVIRPEEPSPEVPVESTKSKKSRKVKKKVIIKRQHRKLSVGETTFFKETEQPDDSSADTEILERAIAYVTDEEDEASDRDVELMKPIKSCIKQREFQVGDWVMYGERFRKTQIRWRKGQITERITSISYKINIDGTEVSAHISYIKKYTDRKVNFGGKEYLEIDYEQIAEEERRARTYSIWNMV